MDIAGYLVVKRSSKNITLSLVERHYLLSFVSPGHSPPISLQSSQLALIHILRHIRDIPSEKIGQNIHPPEICFFVVNYQHWTGTSAFRPFLAPLDHWGGLGGPG